MGWDGFASGVPVTWSIGFYCTEAACTWGGEGGGVRVFPGVEVDPR